MTIAALRALLDEIDTQGGPDAARANRLHLPDDERTPHTVSTNPTPPTQATDSAAPTSAAEAAEKLPIGRLLKWGDEHPDKDVQDQAARGRAIFAGLRKRYAADLELTAITTEAAELEARLAELRAREQELAPAKPKKTRKPVDYPAAEVRAWAKASGHVCPPVGRIPKPIVDAWRASLPQAG